MCTPLPYSSMTMEEQRDLAIAQAIHAWRQYMGQETVDQLVRRVFGTVPEGAREHLRRWGDQPAAADSPEYLFEVVQ